MSKHRHISKRQATPVNADGLVGELREAIDQRRGRKALAMAKLLRKHPQYDSSHHEPVARAYEIRLSEMLAAGQSGEADNMLRMLASDIPECSALIGKDLVLKFEIAGGGSGTALAQYGRDESVTKAVDGLLLRDIRDIRGLVKHPRLPDNHPLREGSAVVINSWREVESPDGPGRQFERMSSIVGRRSPFIHWRLLVQALAAYYAGRDEDCRACLARIPPDSAVRAIKDALLRLLSGALPESPAEEILRSKIWGESHRGDLDEIDRLFAAEHPHDAIRNALETLRPENWPGMPLLRRELLAMVMFKISNCELSDDVSILRAIARGVIKDPGYFEVMCKSAAWDDEDSAQLWDNMINLSPLPTSRLEKALIYDRMARLTNDETRRRCGCEHCRQHEDYEEDDEYELPAGVTTESLWRKSVENHPLPEIYRAWHDHTRAHGTVTDRRDVLESWNRDFSDDETPLLELVNMCRTSGSHQKARRYFAQLDAIARGSPQVEALRHFLVLDSAVTRAVRGMKDRVFKDLESLPAHISDIINVAASVLRWYLAAPEEEAAALERIVALRHPVIVEHVLRVVEERAARRNRVDMSARLQRLEAALAGQFSDCDLVAHDYHGLIQVKDPFWKMGKALYADSCVLRAFRHAALPSATRRALADYLFAWNRELSQMFVQRSMWALTAAGLDDPDEHTPVFLAYRGILYLADIDFIPYNQSESARWRRGRLCLNAAYRLACAANQPELAHLVEVLTERAYCEWHPKDAVGMTENMAWKIVRKEADIKISDRELCEVFFEQEPAPRFDVKSLMKKLGIGFDGGNRDDRDAPADDRQLDLPF